MQLQRLRSRKLILAPLGLLALGVALAGPAPDELAPPERIDRGLNGIMWMVKNANAKLRKGVVAPSSGAGAKSTPALSCCSSNLEKMYKKIRDVELATSVLKGDIASSDTPDVEAMVFIGDLEDSLAILRRSFQSFETAPDKTQAQQGIKAITGAFLQARRIADELLGRLGYERPADDDDKRK